MELEHIASGKAHPDKLADFLEDLPLFNSFSRHEVVNLANYMTAYRARAGATIFTEGGKDEAMWFLVKGRVDIVKESDDEKRCHIVTITAGKSIGEMSVIDGMPYSATGTTSTESILVQFSRQSFDLICHEAPALGIKLLRLLARLLSMRLRHTSGALVHLAGN